MWRYCFFCEGRGNLAKSRLKKKERINKMENQPEIHYPGELAIWDSFSGMIFCRVLEVSWDYYHGFPIVNNRKMLVVQVTARKCKSYKQGEIVFAPPERVIPRACFHRIRGKPFHYVVHPQYEWREHDVPNKP